MFKKISEINSKYGNESSEFDEELVEHLKKKFPKEYELSLEELKNDGSYNKKTGKKISACMPMHTFGFIRVEKVFFGVC